MAQEIVRSSVHAALRGRLAVTAGEALLLAVSAAIVTSAAAVAGGTAPTDGQALAVAGVVAILAVLAWGSERHADARSVARAMDRCFGLSGALLTAFDAESSASASPLANLLSREIVPSISASRFVIHVARSSMLLLAAPFAAMALWILAAEARESLPGDLVEATRPAGAAIAAAPLEALRSEAARLAATPGLPAALAEKLRALAADAEGLRLQPRARDASDAKRAAQERDLAARLAALRRAAQSPGMTAVDREGTMESPDARIEPPPGASMDKSKLPSSGTAPGSSANPADSGSDVPREMGVLASRWWPARYDSIVQRWAETRPPGGDGRSR